MNTKKLTNIALLSSIAIICGYIESLLPPLTAVPGIKLGISNIVILFALLRLDSLHAFYIMLVKVLLSSILFSGIGVLIYSLSGGILSLIIMILARDKLSIIGVSIAGGVFHNVGQLAAAAFMLKTLSVFYYMPVLLVSGLILGGITGMVCKILVDRLAKEV